MRKKCKLKRGCTVPSFPSRPSTMKSNGTEELEAFDSVAGCGVLTKTLLVGTHLRVDATRFLSAGDSISPIGVAGEKPEFYIKRPLRAPRMIFPPSYLLRSFPEKESSASQRGFEIKVFLLLGEQPKATQPRLPVCQSYRWQLCPTKWLSPTTMSLDAIVATAIPVGFPRRASDTP